MTPKVYDLPDDVTTLKAMLTALWAENTAHVLMIEKLKAQLAKLRRMQFGLSSEKLDAAIHQLELMLEEFEGDSGAAEVIQTRAAPETLIPREKPARKPLPDHPAARRDHALAIIGAGW